MARSSLKKKSEEDADLRYGSYAAQLCDWTDPTNMVVIGGRGMAKSTVIMASRSERCIRLMPGAPVAIVANSYANLVNNIMPAVQNGWRLLGLSEGLHYIKGRRPPEDWRRKCSVIVDDYKHVYSFWNGSVVFLGSLDNPSLLAGKSVAHLMFDEAKFASEQKASRVMPILRGDAITYGACHLYGGVTITTDMPDVTEGEYDWFFRYAAEMDPERIQRMVQASEARNAVLAELCRQQGKRPTNDRKIASLEKKLEYWDRGLVKLRKGQTVFMNISSFANIDVLTVDYARRMLNGALELHEFLKSIAGMRPGVRKSARFYLLFGSQHKYEDGTRSGEAAFTSAELLKLDPDEPLDGGMDFGNMMSLVIGQQRGEEYRIHKNFWTLPPDYLRELADQFLDFFSSHRMKVLNLYYDRAGNKLQRQRQDEAGKIKEAIERDGDGRRTGWTVRLMSRDQANIYQDAEFHFMQELMREQNPRLPKLRVDVLGCPEMVSSIELAKSEVKYRGQQKVIAKVKKSEKMELKKLPKLSTNFSDAFKYLMMRPRWVAAAGPQGGGNMSGGGDVADRWMEKVEG